MVVFVVSLLFLLFPTADYSHSLISSRATSAVQNHVGRIVSFGLVDLERMTLLFFITHKKKIFK
jgi:hypothetical protein